ncbi:MAG TPA: YlxR family protein [Bacillota bacterium]|nr:YlxR family protein [Bacillota bacterium]HPF42466.1 YlxR family protein [Bacillota bacterium]HPJ85767.1 YlxR family protein [Bacillota bacterium]HPQ61596.1 YlxR family protein [Bacillota bacterium]HRX91491.1 YlxR family protein [Candidatus Izemoplasmatales bacterium]
MATIKKIPLRRCVVTGERCEKKNLFRVVRTPEGQVIYDPTGKANGRGAYVSRNKAVIEKARKSKVLAKHLECEIPDDLYDLLLGRLTSNE